MMLKNALIKKAELSRLPLVVNPSSSFFNSALFYPEYQFDQIVLNLNVKHPDYGIPIRNKIHPLVLFSGIRYTVPWEYSLKGDYK